VTMQVARAETAAATSRLLADNDVIDLTIEDPPIDDVIEQVFADAAEPS
jgi:ABC-2 type transport system ATP-binding protein